ncbi:MAG: ABC transporter ATP-binding protein [Desulfobacterales bacterium]|jgi:peptide/nickel transport system ATP-binding protein
MSKLLEVRNLNVDIPLAAGVLHAVRAVSFSVEQGHTTALVGESGCGKSLTALAIMDLLPKHARRKTDQLRLAGQDLSTTTERQMADIRGNQMAMIFQEPMTSLNPCYTIGNQLTEALLRHRRVPHSEARDRAVFLLEKVGITAAASRLKQYPHQLSGGLRQRVMIAMGLMCAPALIIADEPTTALDVTIQAQILALLALLQKEFDMGMIMITHDLGVVARIASRVEVMYCGQVVETGAAVEVFENPLHPYTQGLLECIPIPGKTQRGEHLGSIPGMVPTPLGDLNGCMFRNRCAYVFDDCAHVDVDLQKTPGAGAYRCLLSPEICAQNRKRSSSHE